MEVWQGILLVLGCAGAGAGIGLVLGRFIINSSSKRKIRRPIVSDSPSVATTLLSAGMAAELQQNLAVAAASSSSELVAFQTEIWDKHQDGISNLPANLQTELLQAYVDMRLANNIVALTKQLELKNQLLNDNYTKIRQRVAVRLGKVWTYCEEQKTGR